MEKMEDGEWRMETPGRHRGNKNKNSNRGVISGDS